MDSDDMDFDDIEDTPFDDLPSDDPPTEELILSEEEAAGSASTDAGLATLLGASPKSRTAHPKLTAAEQAMKKQAVMAMVQWQYVSPSQLRSRSDQPRQTFEPVALAELTASVQSRGVLQPILVRPIAGASTAGTLAYEIIAGERRWRASQQAGLAQVPILIQHLSDEAASEITLIENLQREDLTPLETASALAQMTQQGYSIRKLATKLGKQKGWVEEHLRLTRLTAELKEMVSGRPDAATHARELEKVSDLYLQAKLIARVRDENLSLSELRRQIREQSGAAPKARQARKGTDAVVEMDTSMEVTAPASASLKEATPHEQPAALPQPVQLEAGDLEEAGDRETEVPGMDGAATVEATLRQSAAKANLRTLTHTLDKLDRPTDPAILAELTQLLQKAQTALTTTLERWAL